MLWNTLGMRTHTWHAKFENRTNVMGIVQNRSCQSQPYLFCTFWQMNCQWQRTEPLMAYLSQNRNQIMPSVQHTHTIFSNKTLKAVALTGHRRVYGCIIYEIFFGFTRVWADIPHFSQTFERKAWERNENRVLRPQNMFKQSFNTTNDDFYNDPRLSRM